MKCKNLSHHENLKSKKDHRKFNINTEFSIFVCVRFYFRVRRVELSGNKKKSGKLIHDLIGAILHLACSQRCIVKGEIAESLSGNFGGKTRSKTKTPPL